MKKTRLTGRRAGRQTGSVDRSQRGGTTRSRQAGTERRSAEDFCMVKQHTGASAQKQILVRTKHTKLILGAHCDHRT